MEQYAVITARYPAACGGCGVDIAVGDQFAYSRAQTSYCVACHDGGTRSERIFRDRDANWGLGFQIGERVELRGGRIGIVIATGNHRSGYMDEEPQIWADCRPATPAEISAIADEKKGLLDTHATVQFVRDTQQRVFTSGSGDGVSFTIWRNALRGGKSVELSSPAARPYGSNDIILVEGNRVWAYQYRGGDGDAWRDGNCGNCAHAAWVDDAELAAAVTAALPIVKNYLERDR